MVWKIPKFRAGQVINDSRHGADIALANSNPFLITRRLIDGASPTRKFGAALGIGTDLTAIATSHIYQTPLTAVALEVVSDSTDDNGVAPGVGALSVQIIGISDWTVGEVSETVTLNGTTPVTLSTSFLRVYRMKVATSGTYASSVDTSHNSTITLRETGGGDEWASMSSVGGFGLGQSEIAAYSIPAGKIGIMPKASAFVEAAKTATILFFERPNADIVTAPFDVMRSKLTLHNVEGGFNSDPIVPYGPFIGPCDVGWMGAATSQTANISAAFTMVVFDA